MLLKLTRWRYSLKESPKASFKENCPKTVNILLMEVSKNVCE